MSNSFILFQGYEVQNPSGEYLATDFNLLMLIGRFVFYCIKVFINFYHSWRWSYNDFRILYLQAGEPSR